MPNNPVQVVLNTENFVVRPEGQRFGQVKDFYAGRDAEFAEHKGRLLEEVGRIREQLTANPDVGIEYAHVVLQSDAWAKSNRPTGSVLPDSKVPVIGGVGFGELLVELTTENVSTVENAIGRAEETVALVKNRQDKLVPKPSRNRSEVGAIQTIRPHLPSDRRKFSAEEAVQWLDDPRTGGLYIVETFADITEFGSRDHKRGRAHAALSKFIKEIENSDLPVERVEPPAGWKGRRMIFLRVDSAGKPGFADRVALHQRILERLDEEPSVRRVLLPPILEAGHATHGIPRAASPLEGPQASAQYPIVGIIDTGVSDACGLEEWCAGRTDYVGAASQDRSHGTFIAGLTSAGGQMNSGPLFSERACKFFDLALFPTAATSFNSFYPRGFLDFLDQLDTELTAATAAGVRVFNMSLALDRQVSDDSYGVFAAQIDSIADKHDVVIVLPSGNLPGALQREEWPETPTAALKMLAEYRHTGKDRILQPAESVRAVVTGAVNPPTCTVAPLRPASYTRRGPSAGLGTKPDVAHVGGRGRPGHELFSLDSRGSRIDGCGTSYAAPLVAKTIAGLESQIAGHVERETLFALLAHHSTLPVALQSNELMRVARDFVGFGVPATSSAMLETGDSSITLVFTGSLEGSRELVFPFSWPAGLVGRGGKCRGRARLTLAYRPPTDSRFDAEFVRINLDAHLRQEHVDEEGEIKWEGRLRNETDKRYEKELIEHGQKWWPLKQYEKEMKRGVGASSQWRLVVDGLSRSGTTFPSDGVPFAVVLTIEDPKGDAHVFQEVRQGLLTAGAVLADVRTANRITTRG